MVLEEHTTPDGLLTLSVHKFIDGIAIGFDGLAWHTHPDLLVGSYGDDEEKALRGFISAILNDKLLIVCLTAGDGLEAAWVEDDLHYALDAAVESKAIKIRYWSGWLPSHTNASAQA
ncbi:hypothetical protein JH26_02905 [Microvirga sp. BSC39]|nr:hypothetical protein JH26_02905 [Microvirga sp. BSC39]